MQATGHVTSRLFRRKTGLSRERAASYHQVMARYVALLRGINVGGKNLIKMTELKACFEEDGFGDVLTLKLQFAAGVAGDPTPICSATMTGSASGAAGNAAPM